MSPSAFGAGLTRKLPSNVWAETPPRLLPLVVVTTVVSAGGDDVGAPGPPPQAQDRATHTTGRHVRVTRISLLSSVVLNQL
jgi:hypothetical protein